MKSIIRNLSLYRSSLLYFIILLVIELAFGFCFVFLYAILSMILFGEGTDSFMYIRINKIIFCSLLVLIPAVFNAVKIYKNLKSGNKAKAQIFTSVLVIFLILSIA